MEWNEWVEVVQFEAALWTSWKVPDERALRIQYEFVRGTPQNEALAAVRALAAEEWPPNAARIALTAVELAQPRRPDFDEIRGAFRKLILAGFDAQTPPSRLAMVKRGLPADVLMTYFGGRRWRQWCMMGEDDTTFYAQQRDEYLAQSGRHDRETRLEALGAGPQRQGLSRMDPAAALLPGSPD